MRIKTMAIGVIAGCTAVTVASFGLVFVKARSAQANAEKVATAAQIRVALYDATIDLSLERSLTQVGLNLPGPMPTALRDLLTRQRQVADSGFSELATRVENAEIAQAESFLKELSGDLGTIRALRSRADPALDVAALARNPADVSQIPASLKASVEQVRSLEAKLLPENAMMSAALLNAEKAQLLAWQVREYGGRERTLLAIATATGAPMGQMELREAAADAQRAEMAQNELLLLRAHPETQPALVAAIDRLQEVYFQSYGNTRQRLLAAAPTGAYGMTLEAFFAESSEALAAAETLAATAGEAAYAAASAKQAQAQQEVVVTLSLSALSLLMMGVLGWFLLRLVVPRIGRLSEEMRLLSQGEIGRDLAKCMTADELGDMGAALKVFQDNQVRMRAMESEQEALKARAEADKRAQMHDLANGFERSVLQVVETVAAASTELQSSSETLARTAADTSTHSSAVARTAEVSASNIQTVASASEEMSASIAEIAQQVTQSAQIARAAEEQAARTNATVVALAEAAGKIGAVVGLISDIAAQTNLLALNATIEAARAGEAGRGFAVVASEVKSLAEQTAKATEEISAQITGVQGATTEAVGAIDGIARTIAEINEIASAISAAVEEQMAAVREITRNTGDVAAGTAEVTQAIVMVQSGASETGAAAEQSLGAARELGLQANRLRDEVEGFLRTIRAA
jgi:methyl-accepting chemotaxis protein